MERQSESLLPFETKQLPVHYDHLALDYSEIRLLPAMNGGELAHCTLPAGGVSRAVTHQTVEEITKGEVVLGTSIIVGEVAQAVGLAGGGVLGARGFGVRGTLQPSDLVIKPSPATPLGEGWAQVLAEMEAAELRQLLTNRQVPSKISVAVDLTTGEISYGASGQTLDAPPILPHPEMEMPVNSHGRYPVNNCAEYKAVDKRLWAGSQKNNLEVYTVSTETGQPAPRCTNCRVTTSGTRVTSD